jgi:hypothetical protein
MDNRLARDASGEGSLLLVNFSVGPELVLELATERSTARLGAVGYLDPRLDPLVTFVRALRCFAAGTPDVSCRWPSSSGGHFLDLSRIGEDRCGIAVHSFADPDRRPGGSWVPARGALVFGADLPFGFVLSAFAAALDDLRAGAAEFEKHWPWPFPEVELSRLKAAQSLS